MNEWWVQLSLAQEAQLLSFNKQPWSIDTTRGVSPRPSSAMQAYAAATAAVVRSIIGNKSLIDWFGHLTNETRISLVPRNQEKYCNTS
jgi:hypothetical protein